MAVGRLVSGDDQNDFRMLSDVVADQLPHIVVGLHFLDALVPLEGATVHINLGSFLAVIDHHDPGSFRD